MSTYQILPELMLRTPAIPFRTFQFSTLQEIIDRSDFRAALFLANSTVYLELKKLQFEFDRLPRKLALTIYNYANRMAYRHTPFGAFSSFSFIAESKSYSGIKIQEDGFILHVSPDLDEFLMSYLSLINSVSNHLKTNSSLYYTLNDGRYIFAEHRVTGPSIFTTRTFDRNSIIETLLKFSEQATKTEHLTVKLNSLGMTDCEAKDLINELRKAQLLLPSDLPSITGKDMCREYMQICQHYEPLEKAKPSFFALNESFSKAEFTQLPDTGYKSLLNPEKPLKFYANLERSTKGSVPKAIISSLHDGLYALDKLSKSRNPPALSAFVKAFKERFDLRMIPIMEAIDPEMGISYDDLAVPLDQKPISDKISPFLEKPNADQMLQWGKIQQLLLNNWPGSPGGIIQITEQLLEKPESHDQLMPPSFSILFRVCGNDIQIDQAGGTSALALMGRFTAFSPYVFEHAKAVALKETAHNPEVIFAEVTTISDGHVDNINRREAIRDYEIPIVTGSQLPGEQQILLSDLFLSVKESELILWSKKLKKRIIPRVSSAFNYQRNNLAIFRLLGDLQYQGIRHTYTFDPEEIIPGLAYYPRIVYKNCILSVATWHISKIELLNSETGVNRDQSYLTAEGFLKFAKKVSLPKVFSLSVSDRSLVYRLENKQDLNFLLTEIKTLATFKLTEVLLEPSVGGTVTDSFGNTFSNQFIATVISNKVTYLDKPLSSFISRGNRISREMITGSEWLYYKLYGQAYNTGIVLLRFNKALNVLRKSGVVYEWFFIRYLDPDPHLRLRIHLNKQEIGAVILAISAELKILSRNYKLTDIQTSTYKREIERYPANLISLIETSFCLSSQLVIKIIRIQKQTKDQVPVYLTGVIPAYWLIKSWVTNPSERLYFITTLRDNMFREFGGSASLKVSLDETKRALRREVTDFMSDERFFSAFTIKKQWQAWKRTMDEIRMSIKDNPHQVLADLLHMHFNRVFETQMREQELVAYSLIHQHEITAQHMAKST